MLRDDFSDLNWSQGTHEGTLCEVEGNCSPNSYTHARKQILLDQKATIIKCYLLINVS